MTLDQWREMFRSVEHFAYHLEMRDRYAVDEEKEEFARWRAGKLEWPTAREDWWRPWHTLIQDTVQRGAIVLRARIVSEPVTDYIQYEWESTYENIEAGEEVRWLPRRLATGIALPGNDFWLFDDRKLLVNLFTGDGGWAGNELLTEPAVIKLCHSAFDAVWQVATPHGDYQPH
ncbi:DUF6879 family protein [Pseudonocardia acaciae]|uniref:DUF6879 family protein n=1 Tax=Pseudonocardia acaciae TaxID=551276 RepID=UPI001B8054E5|nr:DUF6879 family protein [Pseudonocardia acaciae]